MEISKEIKDRIKRQAESEYYAVFDNSLEHRIKAYIAGATAEVERSSVLVEALEQAKGCVEDVVAMDRLNLVAKQTLKKIAEALSLYNNPGK